MLEVNKKYIFKVTGMTHDGCGIGTINGVKVFIDKALLGETVEAEVIKLCKGYAVARLISIVNPRADRVKPFCPYFEKCGGCSLQFISYEDQLKLKTDIIKAAIQRFQWDKTPIVNAILGMKSPTAYRNKAEYPVGLIGSIPVVGSFSTRSDKVIDINECAIQHEKSNLVREAVREYIKRYNVSIYNRTEGRGLLRHVGTRVSFSTGEIMVILVANGTDLPYSDRLVELLLKSVPQIKSIVLNINREKSNIVMGSTNRLLYGKWTITDHIGPFRFDISPSSFFQVNPVQTEVLYNTIVKYAELTGKERIFDLYCGVGTISIYLSQNALKVIGIETVDEAVEAARKNAIYNNAGNVEFIAGRVENTVFDLLNKGEKPDVIVLDPPRKGCKKSSLDAVIDSGVKRVIYVSCNPSTLVRDLKYLDEHGFRIIELQPIDMFPHSAHVETVTLTERG